MFEDPETRRPVGTLLPAIPAGLWFPHERS